LEAFISDLDAVNRLAAGEDAEPLQRGFGSKHHVTVGFDIDLSESFPNWLDEYTLPVLLRRVYR
jgi:hypothetical protein